MKDIYCTGKVGDLVPVDAGGLVVLESGGGEGAVLALQLVRGQVVALVHPVARQKIVDSARKKSTV